MRQRQAGFTLIELVVTVAIVAVLTSIAVPLVELSVQRTKEHELRSSLRQIRSALDAYKRASDEGRVASEAGGSGYPSSLDLLVEGVPGARSVRSERIVFLRRLPRDPFETDATLGAADTWGLRSYSSPPGAPSEGDDVFDVYSRSDRIGMNGRPYKEW